MSDNGRSDPGHRGSGDARTGVAGTGVAETDAAESGTIDAFLGGRLMLQQRRSGYRAGLDAVLLAAACPLVAGEAGRVLDCGAGVGTVGLAVAMRVPDARVVLVERDATTATMARANVVRNGLEARASVVAADLCQPLAQLPDLRDMAGQFDHVLANPPYFIDGDGTAATDDLKRAAHSMARAGLDRWVRFAAAMAGRGSSAGGRGTLTMIHRSTALPELLAAFEGRFGGLRILPIQAHAGGIAERILVSGTKGSRAPLTLLAPLVVHEAGRPGYSAIVEAIVREGAALTWSGVA